MGSSTLSTQESFGAQATLWANQAACHKAPICTQSVLHSRQAFSSPVCTEYFLSSINKNI